MKKNLILSVLFLTTLMFSCTESDKDGIMSSTIEPSSKIGLITNTTGQHIKATPYISEEMQKTLAMIDTCKKPIPIEKLIPNFKNSTTVQTKSTTTTTDGIYTVVTGYTTFSYLYTDVKTEIDATQSLNFDCTAGTYNVDCLEVTAIVSTGGHGVFPVTTEKDTMGINPDNTSQRGYKSEELTNDCYNFTTYLWEIKAIDNPYEYNWIPQTPRKFHNEFAFRNHLNWRYMPL